MSSVSGLGPVIPPNDPRSASLLAPALENYAKLLANPNSDKLETIAQKTVELSNLAHSVMHAASPALRSTASDLEHLLTAPVSVMNKEVSILTACEHYRDNPEELNALVQELCHNPDALRVMCNELTLLSGAVRNPNAPAS